MHVGTPHEVAEQTGIFTRHGIERIARYAFEVASQRPRRMLAQRDQVERAAALDGAVGRSRRRGRRRTIRRSSGASTTSTRWRRGWSPIPAALDVIVASNLFGDILTDIGSAISGSLGVAPGANINPDAHFPSMFEPIHGSAPGHRRQGHRQPDRRDLGRRADAVAPRPPRRSTTASWARSKGCSAGRPAERRISAGRRARRRSPKRSLSDLSFARLQASQAPGFRLQACEAPGQKPDKHL